MIRRVLIFGAAGQVGSELLGTAPDGVLITAVDVGEANIHDRGAVLHVVRDTAPAVVINCAAYTNVDGAESTVDEAMATNGIGPGFIADACEQAGARMLHVSTDYVFDGRGHAPYAVDAAVGPINVYGATKLEGERRVLAAAGNAAVVRTAWVHSGVGRGTNFVKTAARVLGAGSTMHVVDDQVGTPTRARHLARALWCLAETSVTGLLHFTDAGVASWYDVAAVVMETLASAGRLPAGASVQPIRSSERPSVAKRPAYSVLDKHDSWRTIGFVPPHWRDGVVASTREQLDA
jgi:dTDP-4-dehydrorhamnose reductase